MLRLSESFTSTIIQYLVIARVSRSNEKTRTLQDFWMKVRIAVAISFVDSFLVFGVSFFSVLITLGYDNLMFNIKLSLLTAFTMAGVSFFTEMKKQISKK